MKSHLKKRFVSLSYFLPQSFAPLALSSRLCEKVKRSRQGAKREKLEAQRVSVFEARSNLLSLCCLFALSLALITSSRSTTAQSLPSVSSTAPLRLIAADYSRVKGKHDKFFRQVVGAGRAAEGLRADWQRDLDVVYRECGFKYIRFHGLLQDEMGVYSEGKDGQPIYNSFPIRYFEPGTRTVAHPDASPPVHVPRIATPNLRRAGR